MACVRSSLSGDIINALAENRNSTTRSRSERLFELLHRLPPRLNHQPDEGIVSGVSWDGREGEGQAGKLAAFAALRE